MKFSEINVSLWNTTHVYEVHYCVYINVIHPLLWWRLSYSYDEVPTVVETASQFCFFAPRGTLLYNWIETLSATEPHWLCRHKKGHGLTDSCIVIVESVTGYFTGWSYNRVGCLKQNPLNSFTDRPYFTMRLLAVEQTISLLHSDRWCCQFCGAQSCSVLC
jgi:hypothetical protein